MAKAKAAGSFIGALFNNPTFLILGALGIGLLFFQKDIRNAFASIGEGFGKIELPEIKFPDITFPDFPDFPEITFPEFPDFTSIFTGFQEQLNQLFSNQQSIIAGQTVTTEQGQDVMIPPDTVIDPDTGIVTSETPPIVINGGATFQENLFATTRAGVFDTLVQTLGLSPTQAGNIVRGSETIADLERILFEANQGKFTPQQTIPDISDERKMFLELEAFLSSFNQTGFDVPFNDPTNLGGGLSFIGGTTTFGDETNVIDTLSEVLAIFPDLTASQAANALFANPNLTGNEFAQITPFQPSISSAGIDPEQIINNASGGFSGLTPEQIAFILTGGNIQNF